MSKSKSALKSSEPGKRQSGLSIDGSKLELSTETDEFGLDLERSISGPGIGWSKSGHDIQKSRGADTEMYDFGAGLDSVRDMAMDMAETANDSSGSKRKLFGDSGITERKVIF